MNCQRSQARYGQNAPLQRCPLARHAGSVHKYLYKEISGDDYLCRLEIYDFTSTFNMFRYLGHGGQTFAQKVKICLNQHHQIGLHMGNLPVTVIIELY